VHAKQGRFIFRIPKIQTCSEVKKIQGSVQVVQLNTIYKAK